MSDASNLPVSPPASQDNFDTVKLVYILYFLGYVTGIAMLAGLIVAYLNKDKATAAQLSHYRFQIRTFWIGLAYVVVGTLLTLFVIGFLVLAWLVIWSLVRLIKGFMLASENKPVPDPATWLW